MCALCYWINNIKRLIQGTDGKVFYWETKPIQIMCTKDIRRWVSINAINQPWIDISINSWSTSQLIRDQHSIDISTDSRSTLNQHLSWQSVKSRLIIADINKCWSIHMSWSTHGQLMTHCRSDVDWAVNQVLA